ncbi:hypothetical protein Tco_1360800 [Tanacetum coccineum]
MEIDCRFEEMLRPLEPILLVGVGEPEGSNDYTEVPFDDEQILRHHSTAPVTPPPLAYTPTPPVLATMEPLDTFLMGDEVISTIPAREINEFMKFSVNDLVPIPRESEVTSNREHLDTLSTGDREINFNPIRDIEELECLLADNPVPVPRVFDKPLGNSDSVPRPYDVTFSNPLFDFNDDYTLCYDNPLFDEEFEDISSLDPASKPFSLMEVKRFDPFFSLTQSGGTTRVMKTSSFGFHHMPSPRPAAYSPKVVMYFYYYPHLTSCDGFDHEPKMK